MHRTPSRIVAALCALGTTAAAETAHACGACLHPTTQMESEATQVVGHRMLFSVSQQQTTLWDQVEFAGAPESFAWVLPVRAPVEVGLSSDALFQLIEQRTRVTVASPTCYCDGSSTATTATSAATSTTSSSGSGGGVTVIAQETVGPYETVQLSSADGQALFDWLASHNYAIPDDLLPVIQGYVDEGMDFLAMKLVPGLGVQAMQPVRVTSPGAGLTLPLRMVAGGAGAYVPIHLWVFGEGRYGPQSHPWFVVDPGKLVWDWDAHQSNYQELVADGQAATAGRGWLVASAFSDIEAPYSDLCQLAQYSPESSGYDDGSGDGLAASELCYSDVDALLGVSSRYVTHLFANLPHDALADDLVLEASADQSSVVADYQAYFYTGTPPCGGCNGAPVGGQPSGSASASSSGSGSDDAFPPSVVHHGSSDCAYGGAEIPAGGGGLLALLALLGATRRRASRV